MSNFYDSQYSNNMVSRLHFNRCVYSSLILKRFDSRIYIEYIIPFHRLHAQYTVTTHGCHDLINHRRHPCLFNNLMRITIKMISKLYNTGSWRRGIPWVTGGFPSQKASSMPRRHRAVRMAMLFVVCDFFCSGRISNHTNIFYHGSSILYWNRNRCYLS